MFLSDMDTADRRSPGGGEQQENNWTLPRFVQEWFSVDINVVSLSDLRIFSVRMYRQNKQGRTPQSKMFHAEEQSTQGKEGCPRKPKEALLMW